MGCPDGRETLAYNPTGPIGYKPGGRPEVVRAYQDAIKLIQAGKLDEAQAELAQQQGKPDLNFYERGMLANLLSLIALQHKDYDGATSQVKVATDFYTDSLPPEVTVQLYRTRIISSLAEGNIMDAMGSVRRLKNVKGFDANDSILNAVNATRAQIDAVPEFAMSGKIPIAANVNSVQLYLYRRDFAFQDIVGTLDKFELSCKQRSVQSQVTDAAEWHVPRDWSQCYLLVRGTPGTTFKVIQFAPSASQATHAGP